MSRINCSTSPSTNLRSLEKSYNASPHLFPYYRGGGDGLKSWLGLEFELVFHALRGLAVLCAPCPHWDVTWGSRSTFGLEVLESRRELLHKPRKDLGRAPIDFSLRQNAGAHRAGLRDQLAVKGGLGPGGMLAIGRIETDKDRQGADRPRCGQRGPHLGHGGLQRLPRSIRCLSRLLIGLDALLIGGRILVDTR